MVLPFMKNSFICFITLHWLVLPDAVQVNDVVRADTVVLDVRDVDDKSKAFS